MIYQAAQLEALWKQAGGPAAVAPTMAAIALAESGGNPAAHHRNTDGTIDRGLWQINSSHGYGTTSFTPAKNAREAVAVYHSQGLPAWTTYTSGAYKQFLTVAGRTRTKTRASPWSLFGGGFSGVDQGTDWSRAGPIPALGAGRVTDIGTSSIIEGGTWPYVIYQLDQPPLAGSPYVYVAENFRPTVRIGQRLKKGQSIGVAAGSFPYIEIGFNKTPKGWNAVAPLGGQTQAGQDMANYISAQSGGEASLGQASLGGGAKTPIGSRPRPGNTNDQGILDTIGGWFGTAASTIGGGLEEGFGTVIGDAASLVTGPAEFLKLAVWLIEPKTWLRIFEVVLGLTLMLLSLRGLFLIFASRDVPIDFQTVGGAARSLHERSVRPAADTLIPGNAKRRKGRRQQAEKAAKLAPLARFGKVPF